MYYNVLHNSMITCHFLVFTKNTLVPFSMQSITDHSIKYLTGIAFLASFFFFLMKYHILIFDSSLTDSLDEVKIFCYS